MVPIIKDKPGYVRPASFSEAICKSNTTLLTIQKQGGLRSLVGWVKGRLIELFTFLGVFDIVTEYQIQMLATRICAKYYYWTTAELDYAFISFIDGKYGKLYQHKHGENNTTINPQELMRAFSAYEKKPAERTWQDRGRAQEAGRGKEGSRRLQEAAWHGSLEDLLREEQS